MRHQSKKVLIMATFLLLLFVFIEVLVFLSFILAFYAQFLLSRLTCGEK